MGLGCEKVSRCGGIQGSAEIVSLAVFTAHFLQKHALFFAFDPKKKQKVFETALLPGAASYPAMVAAGGKIFAAAGAKMLVFDPASMKTLKTIPLPGGQVEISLGLHSSGRLVGLTGSSVYVVDPTKEELLSQAKSPVPIKCGFAVTGDWVYFGSGAELWRCRLP